MEGLVSIEITGGMGEIVNRAEGQCYYKNGHHYVLFSEELSEDGKKGGVIFSSRLKISDGEVVLRRSLPDDKGGAKHVMEFTYRKQGDEERGCMVDYPTPYGTMRLEIRTRELEIAHGEEEILAQIRYQMMQEGQEINQDDLRIVIKKA
ncbi:MAG: DUF1934 domain-containing protein [Lachnospiraceae bacterium]|nr:DUF1934 domain-containing protein [Lachnospiraceae bacterium]